MSFLKTLTFTSALDAQPSPINKKRAQLIANLKDQLTLLRDPNHSRTRRQRVNVDGERVVKEKRVPCVLGERKCLTDKWCFSLARGEVEFEKGKKPAEIQTEFLQYQHLLTVRRPAKISVFDLPSGRSPDTGETQPNGCRHFPLLKRNK